MLGLLHLRRGASLPAFLGLKLDVCWLAVAELLLVVRKLALLVVAEARLNKAWADTSAREVRDCAKCIRRVSEEARCASQVLRSQLPMSP